MRWLAVIVVLAGCDRVLGLEPRAPDASTSGPFQKQITINPTTNQMLYDFPVGIDITDEDLRVHARPDGADILFKDATGMPVVFERVAYADGSIEAWVRVNLEGPTLITMEYGGELPMVAAADTWSDKFFAVWHLSGSQATEPDSTRGNRDVSATAPSIPGATAGIVGGGRVYDTDDHLCLPTTNVLDMGTASFSYSVWVNVAANASVLHSPFAAGGTPGVAGFAFQFGGNGKWFASIKDIAVGPPSVAVEIGAAVRGQWVHVAAVVDRGNGIVTYRDGSMVTQLTPIPMDLSDNVTTAEPVCIGGYWGGRFAGIIDEMRIYRDVMPAEWIEAEYDNVARRSTFLVIGDEEVVAE